MPWGEEKVDPELVVLVKEFDKKHKPKLLALLAKYPEKRVVTLHSRDKAYKWMLNEFVIGATVEGHVDRPLGTAHPDYQTMVYPINYGYVDGIMAEDDEEQDVYILGSDKPLTTYKGDFVMPSNSYVGDFVIGVRKMQEITLKRKIYTELQK